MPGVLRRTGFERGVDPVNEDRAFIVGEAPGDNLLRPRSSLFDPMRTHRRSAFTSYPNEVLVEEARFSMESKRGAYAGGFASGLTTGKAQQQQDSALPRGALRDYEDVRVNRRFKRPSSYGSQTEETFDVSIGEE